MDERYTAYPSTCTYTISADVPCRPCNKKKCDRDHECLKGIRPETVFTKLEEILG
jgi:ADP-heptose:LPS heptosyltransferase